MEPSLKEGDRILALRWCYLFSKPKKGDIIIFRNAHDSKDSKIYVKRISKAKGKTITVKGDNKHDSLNLKSIKEVHILGKVLLKY